MSRRRWNENDITILRACYADMPTAAIARQLARDVKAVYAKANELGLRKSAEHMRRHHGRVLAAAGADSRFRPGNEPWNKGRHFDTGGRSAETRFGPGHRPHTWQPVGATRITPDGYLQRKVSDTGYPPRDWLAVHRLVWEAAHGPMPAGHVVVFMAGAKTTDEAAITLDKVELITRRELMRRNSVHTRYPPEIARIVQLRGALSRQINRKTHKQEPTLG